MTELSLAGVSRSNRARYKWDTDFFWRDLLKSVFPTNTAANVAFFTATSVAGAAHVLRGRNGLSGRALVNLVRSPVGSQIVDAIAGDAAWRAFERRRLADILEIEKELESLELKRRALLRLSQR